MKNVLFINKPKGLTSFDICYKLRKILNTKKIGHSGTLDPNATGVMIVLFDSATKANTFLTSDYKEYIAEVKIGIETDTLDIDGNILDKEACIMPSFDSINQILKSFLGKTMQLPPLTSAIRLNGRRLYEYQREGKEIDVPLREIEVYEIELLSVNDQCFSFRCKVSSGTYIRALARDILAKLNLIGVLNNLQRTKINDIDISDCDNFDEVLKGNYTLHDTKELLEKRYPTINLLNPYMVIHGRRMKFHSEEDTLLITSNDEAIAIYKRDGDEYKCLRGLL